MDLPTGALHGFSTLGYLRSRFWNTDNSGPKRLRGKRTRRPLTVDIADLQIRQLGPSHTGGIQRHQDRAVKRDQRGFDQASHFFLTEDYGQVKSLLRIGVSSTPHAFLSVLMKKKRRAPTRWFTVLSVSFRSRNKWATYARIYSGPSWSGGRLK